MRGGQLGAHAGGLIQPLRVGGEQPVAVLGGGDFDRLLCLSVVLDFRLKLDAPALRVDDAAEVVLPAAGVEGAAGFGGVVHAAPDLLLEPLAFHGVGTHAADLEGVLAGLDARAVLGPVLVVGSAVVARPRFQGLKRHVGPAESFGSSHHLEDRGFGRLQFILGVCDDEDGPGPALAREGGGVGVGRYAIDVVQPLNHREGDVEGLKGRGLPFADEEQAGIAGEVARAKPSSISMRTQSPKGQRFQGCVPVAVWVTLWLSPNSKERSRPILSIASAL